VRPTGITEAQQLDQRLVSTWSAFLLERPKANGDTLSRASVRTYVRTLSGLLNWGQDEKRIGPDLKARQPKLKRVLIKTLTRDEIQKMEDAAQNIRDALIIRLLADSGIRLGELLGLRADDLLERGRERFIRVNGKTDMRDVPLTPTLYMRLKKYAIGHPGERIFQTNRKAGRSGQQEPLASRTVQNMVKYLAISAGITVRVHPHLLRHSFATRCLQRNMNPLALQKILGHSDLTMISRTYSHLTPSDSFDALLKMLGSR